MNRLEKLEQRIERLEKLVNPNNVDYGINEKTKRKILELRAEGLSYRSIAARTGVGFSSVGRILKEAVK